eukprot:symbB.v1.2.007861.t1/scaffold448.1/size203282/13
MERESVLVLMAPICLQCMTRRTKSSRRFAKPALASQMRISRVTTSSLKSICGRAQRFQTQGIGDSTVETRSLSETNYNVNDKLKPDVWLEPCQVWEIRAADLSISPVHTSAFGVKACADGKGIGLRFPRFLRIRDDKTAEESTGPEQIVEMFEAQASVGGGAAADDDF